MQLLDRYGTAAIRRRKSRVHVYAAPTSVTMSLQNCAALAVYVSAATVALAGLWPGAADAQPLDRQYALINEYNDSINFIKAMMLADQLWWTVLNSTVRFEDTPNNVEPVDHYSESALDIEQSSVAYTVKPFDLIVKLLTSNSATGSEVALIMTSIRYAVECSVLRHLSLQGFLIDRLLTMVKVRPGTMRHIFQNMEHMIRLSIDKLAAMDKQQNEVADIHNIARTIIDELTVYKENYPDTERLNNVSKVMHDVLKAQCTDGTTVYGNHMDDLNRSMQPDALKKFKRMMINERLKGLADIHKLNGILRNQGPLKFDDNLYTIDMLTVDEIKKTITVNRIRMMFIFMNLPITTMADTQWANVLGMDPLNLDITEHIVEYIN